MFRCKFPVCNYINAGNFLSAKLRAVFVLHFGFCDFLHNQHAGRVTTFSGLPVRSFMARDLRFGIIRTFVPPGGSDLAGQLLKLHELVRKKTSLLSQQIKLIFTQRKIRFPIAGINIEVCLDDTTIFHFCFGIQE